MRISGRIGTIGLFFLPLTLSYSSPASSQTQADLKLDFRYSPPAWQTLIAFPDDWQKAIIDDQGRLLLDYPGPYSGYGTTVSINVDSTPLKREKQRLVSPKIPVVLTDLKGGEITVHQEAFSVVGKSQPRIVAITSDFSSTGTQEFHPILTVESKAPLFLDSQSGLVRSNEKPFLITHPAANQMVKTPTGVKLVFASSVRHIETLTVQGSDLADTFPATGNLATEKKKALEYWSTAALPWDHMHIPDSNVQALIESSVRNIYQSRELKNGVPEYRTGPTAYRSIFVVDGAFIFEVATWLGDVANVRKAIDHIMSLQQSSGQVVVMNKDYLKETGIMLWAIFEHARLTQDKAWLSSQWPKIEKAVSWIAKTTQETAKDPKLLYSGLMPPGYADGGIDGVKAEYTNTYWNLSGLKASIEAAAWLGKTSEATEWKEQYNTFRNSFEKAAARDKQTAASGSPYLPILMEFNPKSDAPQKAQWGFCQAVYPGKIFSHDDPLANGTLSMLDSFNSEGLVLNTGWLNQGIWTYFGSFYGHAHLWQGHFEKAQEILYAFGNHASPLLAWREEQMPQGKGQDNIGDMPHNWASAEFIRLVRHLIALERGQNIHFLQAVPDTWLIPGGDLSLKQMASEFGMLNFRLRISKNGKQALLNLGALGTAGSPGHPLIHMESLKRLGFKTANGKPIPDVIQGRWGQNLSLKLAK